MRPPGRRSLRPELFSTLLDEFCGNMARCRHGVSLCRFRSVLLRQFRRHADGGCRARAVGDRGAHRVAVRPVPARRARLLRPARLDPEIGLDTALDLLGWTCERVAGGSAADAVRRLRDARGPVLAGPVEFGLLRHHPGSGTPVESDHFVVVIGVEDGLVHFHDPHGFPFSTLPVAEFSGGLGVGFLRVSGRAVHDAVGFPARPRRRRSGRAARIVLPARPAARLVEI